MSRQHFPVPGQPSVQASARPRAGVLVPEIVFDEVRGGKYRAKDNGEARFLNPIPADLGHATVHFHFSRP